MAIFEKAGEAVVATVTKSPVVVVGVGAAIAAPFVVPLLRPLAKGIIKSSLLLTTRSREFVVEAGERWSDLVAEARAELATNGPAAAQAEVSEIIVTGEA